MKILMAAFVFLSILFLQSVAYSDSNWQLAKNSNGVKMYTKSVDGYPIRFFKGEMFVNASLQDTVAALSNVSSHSDWIPNIKYSEIIEVVDKNSYIFYQTYDPPFLKSRDIVARAQSFQDPTTLVTTISINSQHNVIPEKTGLIRIKTLSSKWIFTPILKEKTKVEYEGYYDPDVSVPLFVLNFFITDHPYQTLNKLKSLDFTKTDKTHKLYHAIKNPD